MDKTKLINKIKLLDGLNEAERNELLNILETKKTYGLVWEEKPEAVEQLLTQQLPVLVEVEERRIVKSEELKVKNEKKVDNTLFPETLNSSLLTLNSSNHSPNHILIEGDNLHALTTLSFTHEGKIDVIYIDPPYNTGSKDWKYNNDYVEKDDNYKHSKWLSFMNKRLKIAKRLLTKEGILVCTIDENEHCELGMLLKNIFSDKEIVCVTIIHNPGGIQGKNFSYCHEYAYFVFPNEGVHINLENRTDNPDIRPLRNVSTGTHLREDAANMFYPVYVKDNKIIGFGDVCSDDFHPGNINIKREDGILEIYPIDTNGIERKWVFARQSVEKIKDELSVEWNRQRKVWDVIRKKTKFNYKTVWTDSKYNANIFGTQLISQIINTKFPFPKSLYAVIECLKASKHPKSATILDFFAGSGTTMHAVMQLNAEDGGERQCILVTNNENRICEEVTYERNKRVIEGYKNAKGETVNGLTNNNLRYYRTDFVDKTPSLENKLKLTRLATDLLCIKENCYHEQTNLPNFENPADLKIFGNNLEQYICIIYNDLDIEKSVEYLKQFIELHNPQKNIKVYVFSNGQYPYTGDFDEIIERIELCALPNAIYKAYRHVVPLENKMFKIEENKNIEPDLFNQ